MDETDVLKHNDKISEKFILKKLKVKSINTTKTFAGAYGWDIETYTVENGICKPYAICVYSELNSTCGGKTTIQKKFYGIECVKHFCNYIDEIATPVNKEKTRPNKPIPKKYFYSFNGSRFDNLFIYAELYNREPHTKYCFAGNSIKYIKYNNINFFDIALFYNLGSLRNTSKAFGLQEEKGVFPYKFVNTDNLNYIGGVPELKYWNSKKDYNKYLDNVSKELFDMKEYTLKYCMLDSKLVFKLAEKHLDSCTGKIELKAGDMVIDRKFWNVINCPTSANLSIKMNQQLFLKDNLYQSPDEIIKHERDAYKGGRTEVFKKHFKVNHKKSSDRLYYFDINSAYPAGMTQMMPYKYQQTCVRKETKMKLEEIVDYHLYYIKSIYVGSDPFFIPNLLYRTESKNIIATKNTPYSWHWGNEVKEAILNKCDIYNTKVVKYEGHTVFKEFSEYFYESRLKVKKTNIALSQFYKSVLNSQYGKYGQKCFNKSAIVKNNDELKKILKNDITKLVSFEYLDDFMLIEYKEEAQEYKSIGQLARFSSYIASTSRCKLSDMMRDVGHNNVYYCDTDSVFTSKIPSKRFLDNKILGKWKEETETPIIEAVFLAPKVYYYTCEDEYVGKACKGINKKHLTKKNYMDLYDGTIKSIPQTRDMFFRSLDNIKILAQERNLHIVYNKRIWDGDNSEAFETVSDWKVFNS
jgi:hypothetical protein